MTERAALVLSDAQADRFFVSAHQALDQRRDLSVYFIRAGDGAIKIGFARNVTERMHAIGRSHAYPLKLIGVLEGGKALEQQLHKRFSAARLNGEWFAATPEVAAFIYNIFGIKLDD